MKTIRDRFEEIWPVPEGVYWREQVSCYWTENHSMGRLMDEWNDRLDTFTRCQETNDVYVSLVEELVAALDHHWTELPDCVNKEITGNLVARAKQIMEQKK